MPRFHLPAVAFLLFSLGACGGGGGSGGPAVPPLPSPPQQAVILGTPSMDGYIVAGVQAGPSFAIPAGGLFVGDADALNSAPSPTTAYLSFDISGIPAGSTIISATLRVYQLGNTGSPGTLGDVRTIHIDYGPTFEVGDLTSLIVSQASQVIATNVTSGWREADVMKEVEIDLARSSPRAQFMLSPETNTTNNNGVDDAYAFEDSDNTSSTGFRPELVIVYTAP